MTELNIGALTDSKSYTGSVGAANIFDLYKFNIASPGNFKFAIDNLSGNADIFLLNSSGTMLYSSTNAGNAADTIITDSLIAGDYTLKVLQVTGDIKYTLNLAETNTLQAAAADTLTGAKSEDALSSNSVATLEKPTANKDAITGDAVDDKIVTAEVTPATTDRPVITGSETVKSEPEKTVTAEGAIDTPSTTEKPVIVGSETVKTEPKTTVTAEGAIDTPLNTEKPVIAGSETNSKAEPEKSATAGETVVDKELKTGDTVAVSDASKPAEKSNTATNIGEDKKTENADTSIPTAETTKELESDRKPITASNPFTQGTFIVGSTGKVSIDYLLDGGLYRGQLAIISLKGMEKFVPGSEEFIKEAAARAMSNSEKGYIAIDDLSEGARFSGNLPEGNFNEGAYSGVKTFAMTPGDEFGIMIVPNDTVKFAYDNPAFGGDKRPLFSMVTANPNEAFHLGQIADVTGEGNTFAMEDLRFDLGTDKDYNDFTFQIRGATGKAPLMDSVVNPDKDWRKTDLGKAVIAYAMPYITPEPETKPNLEGEVTELIDDLEKEILNPSTSDKKIPKTPEPTANNDKNTAEPTKVAPTDKVDENPDISEVKTEGKVKDTANDSDTPTTVETAENVDSHSTFETTTPTDDKDIAADNPEKLPVEKTPVSPAVAIEEKDKIAETPAATNLPDRTSTDPEVAATKPTEKVETKPEVLPAETKTETEVVKTEIPKVGLPENSVGSAAEESQKIGAIEPNKTAEVQPNLPVKETGESMPVTAVNKGEESPAKEIVTETETPAVSDVTVPKESLPTSQIVEETTENNSTPVTAPNKEELAQKDSDVNADWIARLESIKQHLSNLGSGGVVGENAGDRTLISRLETMTEKLKEQTKTTPISDNTAALISRLEDMVVKVAPKPVAPVQAVQFEFPQADRPLVGFITETGLTVNNPAGEKSAIVAQQKPANSTTNSSPSASAGNSSIDSMADRLETAQSNGTIVNNNPQQQPVAKPENTSVNWVQNLIKFVDDAKVSKQPHAVVNININLTETQPDGTVIPRSKLTAEERAAIAYAHQNNVIVVVPAGDNPGTMSALGLLSKEIDSVVTVGAAQRFNDAVALSNAFKLADYSGSGNSLDILAGGSSDNTSSTKVAAVEVTNAIAQVLAANPKLNYTQAIDIIKRTATDLDRPNWDAQTGSGLLNVAAAVQLAKVTVPELYTVKPGLRTITDVFISQHPNAKQLPGDPTHPAAKVPGIPQTNVDRGSNNLANATQLIPSATEDVIDQVSSIDPSDIYRVDSRYLNGAKFSVLSGDLSVSYLTTSGQLLGTQSFSKGSHKLQLPANAPAEVIVKIDQRNANPATYVLSGFESTATEPFNIDLEYETPLSASQQAIMQAAAKSVAGLIGKGLPSAVVDGKIIDDINIKISTANIDGAIGTQARTKIDFMRYGTMLPAQSLVQFDAADIAELERSGKLFGVVQHEFLHALGFGNLWEAKGLVDYAGTPLAQYNGKQAVDAFKDLGGLTDAISLETEGKGSAGFHWNEALFQDEVMTADLNFSGKAGNPPISPVTIASLADLGYEVNLNAATPDFGLFGGARFNAEDLTPEQIEAFRQLAEIFGDGDEPSEPAILQEVDPSKVAPEIWAHAERAPNGEYYDWVDYVVSIPGDGLIRVAERTMGSGSEANWRWIADRNGIFQAPYWIYLGDTIQIPVHRPNYEQEQEAERQRREQELRERQEREARERQEAEDRARNNQDEQERIRQDEERRRQEAEARQRELEEQERRLREQMELRRREEERRIEEERLRELARQAEIARQQGKGGLDWYLAKPLPEFGPVDPFQTSLTGETVGNLVPDDYYRFTLSRGGRITAELRKLLADADLVLYDVRNRPIAYSMREGITDEQIIADLIPGTYMLRVNSPKGVTTDYELIVKFQHKLSATQTQPLPPGWRPVGSGNSGGSGGGTRPGATFADSRIQKIYNTALNQFETAERGKANALIRGLETEKRGYQQELNDLLAQMNAEQRTKVHTALDGVRNDAFAWLDSLGEPNGFDNFVNGIFDKIPSWVYGAPFIGDALRVAKDNAKGAFNGALSWIKGKVNSARNEIKNAVSWFVDALKNAYRTGGEINSAIEGLAQEFKGRIDAQVRNINNGIDWFKTEAIKNLGGLRNVGVPGWNFYDNLVVPQADNLANLVKGGVGAIANSLKGTVDYVKPRAQKAVAIVVDALFGDKTGNLYNKINGIDQQIAATTRAVEERIVQKAVELKVDVDNWLNKLANDGKKLLDTILTLINSPGGQIGIEVVKVALGFVPIVGQAIDIIDTAVALWKIVIDGKRDTETFVELLGSLAGWFPGVGDAIKGVAKIAFKGPIGALLKQLGPDVTKQVAKVFKEANWKKILLDVVEGIGQIWRKFDSTMDNAAGWILDLMPGVKPALAGVGELITKLGDEASQVGSSVDDISKQIAKKVDDEIPKLPGPDPNTPKLPGTVMLTKYNFPQLAEDHVLKGDFVYLAGGGNSQTKLRGGLHTQTALEDFINNNGYTLVSDFTDPVTGVRKVELPTNALAPYPNGKLPVAEKSLFPKNWNDEKIKAVVGHIAETEQPYTDAMGRQQIKGNYDGVTILIGLRNGEIVTAYPL
ncbi:MAG: DUF4114 domain-containing protein [Oscillatoriaceae cyanobacterium Prado104]|jgi:hypothetical protein|nr:DUF4114 domain-containing protein [Oscillatoriaceae cyanobacterium Prado104]